MKASYRYQPLESNSAIRMLTLDPGKKGDPLKGTLEVVPIDCAGGGYEALSYVWAGPGPRGHANEILLRNGNGQETLLALREGSIVAALLCLRLPDRPRQVWADQCCINQDDLVERSNQVQFMNTIYQNATRILVWLGPDTEEYAAPAFHFVCKLDNMLERHFEQDVSSVAKLETIIIENQKTLKALTDLAWVCFQEKAVLRW